MDRHTTTGRLLGLAAISRCIMAPRWANPNRQQKKGICMPMTRRWHAWFLGSLIALGVAAAPVAADVVTDWNANAGVAATAACIAPLDNPLHESRIYAMMHVAIHDALNAIDRRSRPYTFDMQAEPGASLDAAVAAAARDVLVPLIGQLPLEITPQSCIDAGVASVEADYTAGVWLPS